MAQESRKYYFVDESGDGVLFGRKGEYRPGSDGCQEHFILGLLDVVEPDRLTEALTALRRDVLNDPYFRGVPSLDPAQAKTATAFHAKDDLPEIRKMVFDVLLDQDVRFSAVVKSMRSVYDYVKGRNAAGGAYRYHPDELYDHMARRLFKGRLHKESEYEVCFARRGKSDRTRLLAQTLEDTRRRFGEQYRIASESTVSVTCSSPRGHGGLQAVDYFLWALQRLYEREEDRFVQLLWCKVSRVHDIDDIGEREYGTYYNERRPLTSEAFRKRRLRI